MPIYEYSCLKCGERTESLQGLHDAPLTTCEACGGELKKLLSAPSFQFKGSGWYVTDYAKKGGKPTESSESKGEGASKSGGESKSGSESKSRSERKSGSDTKSESSSGSTSTEKKESSA